MAAATAVAVFLGEAGLPAQAATPGWRQVFSAHYGAAGNHPDFIAIVATSAKSAWVLGGSNVGGGPGTPVAERWNGRAWSPSALPKGITDDAVVAASAPAADDIWAVTQFDGDILHWNGKAWSVAKRLPLPRGPVGPQLTGVVALSATNVWAFGSSGFTLGWGTWHYNGKSWSQWHGYASGITDGSAVSPANIWAVGGPSAPQSMIVHYTGAWRAATGRLLSGLQFEGIQAFSAADVWASAVTFGKVPESWLLHYDGRAWSKFRVPWSGMQPGWGHIVSDGHGGLWLSMFVSGASGVNKYYEVHRTAKGAWGRTAVGASLTGLAHIPGTASVWGMGAVYGTTGSKAVIWAYGPV